METGRLNCTCNCINFGNEFKYEMRLVDMYKRDGNEKLLQNDQSWTFLLVTLMFLSCSCRGQVVPFDQSKWLSMQLYVRKGVALADKV